MTFGADDPVRVRAAGVDGPFARLEYSQFFGRFRSEADAAGFVLARLEADRHHDVQRHTHETAHFIFLLRGQYISSAFGAPDVCGEPMLIYNPPGTTHRDRFRQQGSGFDGEFLSISIAPDRMRSLREGLDLSGQPVRVASAEAFGLAANAVSELAQWEPASVLAVEEICLELAAFVARRDVAAKHAPPWLAIARELLHDCGDAGLSIGEIARECAVHPVHLARTFRRFFGCSPGAYLRRTRIRRAAALLRTGRTPLTDVALRSGFADQSHMTRAFQRALALTPAAYRRTARGDCGD